MLSRGCGMKTVAPWAAVGAGRRLAACPADTPGRLGLSSLGMGTVGPGAQNGGGAQGVQCSGVAQRAGIQEGPA